jgi:hypothetical protein
MKWKNIFQVTFHGVPQGSVLGPLLFILYVNYIPHLTQGRSVMYADDTWILNIGQRINELQNITSGNRGVVEQYFEINNLLINPTETHYILFQTKQCRSLLFASCCVINVYIYIFLPQHNSNETYHLISITCLFSTCFGPWGHLQVLHKIL